VFQNIVERKIDWMEDIIQLSPETRDLMEKLMCTDVSLRLGSESSQDVQDHEWFRAIKWDTLWQEPAPFIPASVDIEDTGYFDDRGADIIQKTDFEDFSVEKGTDFGESVYKNLQVLERENQKIVSRIKQDHPLGEGWLQKRRESIPLIIPGITSPTKSHRLSHVRHNSASPTTSFSHSNLSPNVHESPKGYMKERAISSIERVNSISEFKWGSTDMQLEVLIADNNPVTSKMLETILKDCNCTVVTDGSDCLKILSRLKFDFIFVKQDLPLCKLNVLS
jgi:hypothetical protein